MGVVRACHKGGGGHLRKAMFGGIIRQALQLPNATDALAAMEKVKAHQDLAELEEGPWPTDGHVVMRRPTRLPTAAAACTLRPRQGHRPAAKWVSPMR